VSGARRARARGPYRPDLVVPRSPARPRPVPRLRDGTWAPILAAAILLALLAALSAARAHGAPSSGGVGSGPGSAGEARRTGEAPIPIRFVVVTQFEVGADAGDVPGELQLWKERLPLTERLPLPHGHHDLWLDRERGVLALLTGIGNTRAAATVTAVGLDPRLDLSRAYWLVAGIAGIDPEDGSLGSAAWARWVVDGDLGHAIDPREIPDAWPDGRFPLNAAGPLDPQTPRPRGEVFRLNGALARWAFERTRDLPLPDSPALAGARAVHPEPAARRPPFVLLGDVLASSRYWHGRRGNAWAERWVAHWTGGEGEFVMAAMEDAGTLQALTWLDRSGRVDAGRVLVLRTASNYTVPPPGVSPAENLLGSGGTSAAFRPAVEHAWLVGSTVLRAVLEDWDRFRDAPPGPAASAP
jgi:purine nucleoside permease